MPDVSIPVASGTPVSLAGSLGLEVLTSVDPGEWDRAVETCGGTSFHSHAWAEYRCLPGNVEPRFFLWRDEDGSPLAVAVGDAGPRPPLGHP
jgi:hypothetical protein